MASIAVASALFLGDEETVCSVVGNGRGIKAVSGLRAFPFYGFPSSDGSSVPHY
jgi:hypothetical protein